jgi:hypothetical protein
LRLSGSGGNAGRRITAATPAHFFFYLIWINVIRLHRTGANVSPWRAGHGLPHYNFEDLLAHAASI